MKTYISIFSLVLIIIVIGLASNSCSETLSVKEEAIHTTVDSISSYPNYQWFKDEINNYKPDTNVCKQIKLQFKKNVHNILFFGDFSCGCSSQGTDITHIIKAIRTSGMTDIDFSLYSMRKTSYDHPFKKYFQLNILPSAIVMKDSVAVYSILDSMIIRQLKGDKSPIETYLLEALKK